MGGWPELGDYQKTVESLRQAARALGQVRSQGHEPMLNNLQWAAKIESYGLSSGHLEQGYILRFDYEQAALYFDKGEETVFHLSLHGSNQQAMLDEVFAKLNENGISYTQQQGKDNSSEEFTFDPHVLDSYLSLQGSVDKVFNQFRTSLPGYKTPVVVWPHGFDVSFLWFPGGNDESKDKHVNFGFSPGLGEEEPYLYCYVWPEQNGFVDSDLPPGGYWAKDWPTPGAKIPYSAFAQLEEPEQFVLELFEELKNKASS